MEKNTILVVEDDASISNIITYNLDKSGYKPIVAYTGEKAIDLLDAHHIDLLILDIMLPKMNGFEICRSVRNNSRYKYLPIIILSARGEETDRIFGFELGADDYIVKPFSPRELILRIKAILKWGKSRVEASNEILEFEKLIVDFPRHKVYVNNKETKLTTMEFKLLSTLLRRQGRVQSRDQLLQEVWDMDSEVTTRTIDTHISFLRKKLGEVGKSIETIRGYGYRLSLKD